MVSVGIKSYNCSKDSDMDGWNGWMNGHTDRIIWNLIKLTYGKYFNAQKTHQNKAYHTWNWANNISKGSRLQTLVVKRGFASKI